MNPRQGARLLAAGRVAFGLALVAAPDRVGRGWLAEHVDQPAVLALVRSIGVRDVVLGMIALHTVKHPEIGPRWQATCAVVDCVDVVGFGIAHTDLPGTGLAGNTLIAGGSAMAGFYFSRALKHSV